MVFADTVPAWHPGRSASAKLAPRFGDAWTIVGRGAVYSHHADKSFVALIPIADEYDHD